MVRGDPLRVRPVKSAMESLTDELISIAIARLIVAVKSSMRQDFAQYAEDLR